MMRSFTTAHAGGAPHPTVSLAHNSLDVKSRTKQVVRQVSDWDAPLIAAILIVAILGELILFAGIIAKSRGLI